MEIAQEGMVLRGPKNKKQIGQVGKSDKIYIEDYAVTYLHQIARAPETKQGFAGLFGTCRETEGVKEYYIYAACYQECTDIMKEGLPGDAVQKIMQQRSEEFCEYFFLGWALLLEENCGTMWESCYRSRLECLMGKPELLMTLQCKSCEEHFYLYPTEMPKEADGYFIFYEQNDRMQNFLIEWHGENKKDKCDGEGDLVAHSCRNYYKEKKAVRLKMRLAYGMFVTAGLLLLLGVGVGIRNLNDYEKLREVGNVVEEVNFESEEVSEVEIFETEEVTVVPETDVVVMSEETQSEVSEVPEYTMSEEVSEYIILGETTEHVLPEEVPEYALPEEVTESGSMIPDSDALEESIFAEAEFITYEVNMGDTLYGICVSYYGNLARAKEICELNDIEDMDNIRYGEKILLPR